MAPRSLSHEETTLHELRTILMLEETLGVKGIRQLRAVIRDEEGRNLLDEVVRGAADTTRDLDDVIAAWTRDRPQGAGAVHEVTGGLDRQEIVQSFIELKESEAAMLRRAAENAPEGEIAEKLRAIAEREEEAARKLKEIL